MESRLALMTSDFPNLQGVAGLTEDRRDWRVFDDLYRCKSPKQLSLVSLSSAKSCCQHKSLLELDERGLLAGSSAGL